MVVAGVGFKIPKSTYRKSPLTKCPHLLTLPEQFKNWEASNEIYEPKGTVLIKTNTYSLLIMNYKQYFYLVSSFNIMFVEDSPTTISVLYL